MAELIGTLEQQADVVSLGTLLEALVKGFCPKDVWQVQGASETDAQSTRFWLVRDAQLEPSALVNLDEQVSYQQVARGIQEQQQRTRGHYRPVPISILESTFKLLISENRLRLRAAVTDLPVYPRGPWVGPVRADLSPHAAYVAAGVLNSGFASAFMLTRHPSHPGTTSGTRKRDLLRIPVPRPRETPAYDRAALASYRLHQIGASPYAGECRSVVAGIEQHLRSALADLYGLSDEGAAMVLTAGQIEPDIAREALQRVLETPLPTPILVSDTGMARFEALKQESREGRLSQEARAELNELRHRLRWQDRIQAPVPHRPPGPLRGRAPGGAAGRSPCESTPASPPRRAICGVVGDPGSH